ncbi:hypothetical protein ACFV7Q_22870 [Streptomyces sp. NPDC059851]|uniref:hypothetical protein n=1 Tax=Streptomyces sp. NPDC059851 TaxID=3346971 RepID=UPI003652E90D
MFRWGKFGRKPAHATEDDRDVEAGGNGPRMTSPAAVRADDRGSGLGNSLARGAAEGTARELVKEFLTMLISD